MHPKSMGKCAFLNSSHGARFISLGCPKNRVNCETMLAVLDQKGCAITPVLESAKTIVVNTCALLEEAKSKGSTPFLK